MGTFKLNFDELERNFPHDFEATEKLYQKYEILLFFVHCNNKIYKKNIYSRQKSHCQIHKHHVQNKKYSYCYFICIIVIVAGIILLIHKSDNKDNKSYLYSKVKQGILFFILLNPLKAKP